MKFFKLFVLPFIFVGSFAAVADAASVNRTVNAGKTSPIFVFYVFNPETCYTTRAPKTNLRGVSHGKLTYKTTPFRVPKGKQCSGRKVNAVTVYYTPKRGYRGKDKARFGFSYSQFTDDTGYNHYGVTANITVK